jgi:hypothetical protein
MANCYERQKTEGGNLKKHLLSPVFCLALRKMQFFLGSLSKDYRDKRVFLGLKKYSSMQKRKGLWSLIGFLLMGLGLMSLIFSMVGMQFSFMQWIDAAGRMAGFLFRLIMIIAGIVVLYLANTNFEEE